VINVVDALKGFPEAITSVFPQTIVQTCIVNLIRNSLAFVSWKDRKAILPSIKAIYRAENADMAFVRLEEFEAEWGKRYPAIGQAWRRAWEHVVPFFAFAPGIRRMIYTTNAVEALHRSLRKIIKTRGSFPNDDAALKLHYLAIKNAGLRWRRGVEWTTAMGQFAIQFGEAFSRNSAMIMATGIIARPIMAWSAASPSSPAPSARHYAALGLDRSPRPSKLSDHA
jgi:putative transposase